MPKLHLPAILDEFSEKLQHQSIKKSAISNTNKHFLGANNVQIMRILQGFESLNYLLRNFHSASI